MKHLWIVVTALVVIFTAVFYWAVLKTSDEVLNSFKLVSNGMEKERLEWADKGALYLDSLRILSEMYPDVPALYYQDALKATDSLSALQDYMEALKLLLIDESGGYVNDDTASGNLKGKKNYDVTTALMVEKKLGDSLQQKILDTRAYVLSLDSWTVEDTTYLVSQMTLDATFNEHMKTAAKKLGKRSWAEYLFDHVPVIAANTILTKLGNDAENTGALVNQRLYEKAKDKTNH